MSPDGREAGDLRRRIVVRSLKYMLSRSVTGGLGALASLLLFRVLGPSEAGKFNLVLAFGMTLGTIGGLGFHNMLARFVPGKDPVEAAGLFRRSLRIIVQIAVLGSAVFAVLVWKRIGIPVEVRGVAPIFLIAVLGYSVYSTSIGMLQGQGRLSLIPRLDFGTNFLAKAVALGVVLIIPGYAGGYVANTAVQIGTAVVGLYILRGALRSPEFQFSSTELTFARMVLLGDVIRVLADTVNLFAIRYFMEPADVGIFAAGARLTRMVEMLVLSPMAVPLLFYFSHPDSSHMKERILRRGSRVVGVAMGLAALLLTVLAEPVVTLFLGDAYLESVRVAQIFAFHALGVGLLILIWPFYSSINKPQYSILQSLLTFVGTLALDLVLIPRYGAQGAAVASVAAIALTVIAANLFLKFRFGIHGVSVLIRIFALYGVCFVLADLGHGALACVLYLAALWPMKLVHREDYGLFMKRGVR